MAFLFLIFQTTPCDQRAAQDEQAERARFGNGVEENWLLSIKALPPGRVEKSNCPVCSANVEMLV
jgi:hypothetical protein